MTPVRTGLWGPEPVTDRTVGWREPAKGLKEQGNWNLKGLAGPQA